MFDYCTVTPHGTFTRKSNRKYTHLVVCSRNGGACEVNYCGSEELAEKKARSQRSWGYTDINIYPVGIKGGKQIERG